MPLEMIGACGRCESRLSSGSEAYICSFEHTYCPRCTWLLEVRCPDCGGELARRPRRDARRGGPVRPGPESDG